MNHQHHLSSAPTKDLTGTLALSILASQSFIIITQIDSNIETSESSISICQLSFFPLPISRHELFRPIFFSTCFLNFFFMGFKFHAVS